MVVLVADAFEQSGIEGLRAAGCEQCRREIEPGDGGPRARGGPGGVARAARHVEHAHAGLDLGARHHQLADFRNVRGQRAVLAGRPHVALARLELVELQCRH